MREMPFEIMKVTAVLAEEKEVIWKAAKLWLTEHWNYVHIQSGLIPHGGKLPSSYIRGDTGWENSNYFYDSGHRTYEWNFDAKDKCIVFWSRGNKNQSIRIVDINRNRNHWLSLAFSPKVPLRKGDKYSVFQRTTQRSPLKD